MTDPVAAAATRPKRNSGRNGNRRFTAAEASQRDQHAITDHRRRYGQPLPPNAMRMPGPPNWFSEDQASVWRYTLAAAPPGLLTAVDRDNLIILCTATALYQRLARKLGEQEEPDAELIQQLRLVGSEAGRASRVLGINPSERARIGLPVNKEQDAAPDQLQTFPLATAA